MERCGVLGAAISERTRIRELDEIVIRPIERLAASMLDAGSRGRHDTLSFLDWLPGLNRRRLCQVRGEVVDLRRVEDREGPQHRHDLASLRRTELAHHRRGGLDFGPMGFMHKTDS